jgi:gliding motility-associated lipoprotein GldH
MLASHYLCAHMYNVKYFVIALLGGSIGFFGCGPDYVYQSEKKIEHAVWTYRDSAVFEFDVQDTSKLYNLYLNLAAQPSFATENLYVRLHTAFPDGKRLALAKSFDVFDKQGKVMGSKSGGAHVQHIMLQEHTFFNQMGKYRIVVEQFMRQDSLPGIEAIGLDVERSKAAR